MYVKRQLCEHFWESRDISIYSRKSISNKITDLKLQFKDSYLAKLLITKTPKLYNFSVFDENLLMLYRVLLYLNFSYYFFAGLFLIDD